jgi:hypothetical protein
MVDFGPLQVAVEILPIQQQPPFNADTGQIAPKHQIPERPLRDPQIPGGLLL